MRAAERAAARIPADAVEAVRAALAAAMGLGVQFQGPGYATLPGAPQPDALAMMIALSADQGGGFSISATLSQQRFALSLMQSSLFATLVGDFSKGSL